MNQSVLYQRELYKKVRKNTRNPTSTQPLDHIMLPPDNLKKAFTPPRFRKVSTTTKKSQSRFTEIFGRNPQPMPPMTEIFDIVVRGKAKEPLISPVKITRKTPRKSPRKLKKRESAAPIQRQRKKARVLKKIEPTEEIQSPVLREKVNHRISNRKFPERICSFLKKLNIFDTVPLYIQNWRDGTHLSNLVSRLEMVELKGIHNKPTKKPQILHNLNQALSILRNKKGFKSSHLFETIEIQEGNEKSIIGLLTDISKNYRNHFLTLQPKKKIKRSVSTNKRPSSARKGRDSRQRSSGVFRRGSIGSIQQRKNVDVSSSLRIGKSDSFLEWLQSIGFNKANPRIFHNPSPNVLRDPLRNGSFLRDLLLFLEPQPKQPNYFWKKNSIPRVVTGADQRVKVSLNFLQSKSHRFNSISSRQIVDGNRGVYYTIQQVYKSTIQPKKYSKQQQVTKKKKKKAKKQKNVDLRSRSFLAGLKESKDFAERQQHLAKMKRQLAVERKLLNWMERIGVLDDGQFLLPPKKTINDRRHCYQETTEECEKD